MIFMRVLFKGIEMEYIKIIYLFISPDHYRFGCANISEDLCARINVAIAGIKRI